MDIDHLVMGERIALHLIGVTRGGGGNPRDFLDGIDHRAGKLDVQEEGVSAASAGDLDDELVVVIADLAQRRALVIASANAATVVFRLRPQELHDRIVHGRFQYMPAFGAKWVTKPWPNR